jgi:Fe2+ transport system protein B
MSSLALMLFYGVYSNRNDKKQRNNKANEVVESLNNRMLAIKVVADQRHSRYVERHVDLEKQIDKNEKEIEENEKSIGIIGEQLIAMARKIDKSNLESKDILDKIEAGVASIKKGIDINIKSMPKKKKMVKKARRK